ncbi:MAG: hypothetical protein GY854_23175, partial [Deltaproteobacteria bacterium]|nr:hypothetical protein [Deltaproteobacteria bacterium]
SGLWHIPPLSYLIDLNEAIKSSWIENEDFEPPFGHAELLSLKRLCKKTDIDIDRALTELGGMKIEVESADETLKEIARNNNTSPKVIFGMIKKLRKKTYTEKNDGGRLSPDDVLERFEGTGIGRKTVASACAMAGEKVSRCLSRLEHQRLDADPGETVKTVANRAGKIPIQVLQLMLVDQ